MAGTGMGGNARLPSGLARSATLLEHVLETLPDAMLLASADGTVAFANSQAESLFGYSRAELMGSHIDELVPLRFREKHARNRATYNDSPHVRPMGANLDIYALRKDGSEFPAEISLSYLDSDDGLLVSVAIRDATDRKRKEHTLDERLRFEQLISAIASTLSEVAPDRLDTSINDGLRQIGRFFGMNRCYLNQISGNGSEFRVTHLWHGDDSVDEEQIRRLELDREFPWFAKKILARESIFVSRLNDLPSEAAAERQYCLDAGLSSFAVVPLVAEETILGNLGITDSAPTTWPVEVLPRLKILCGIFANALARRRKEAELLDAFQEIERLKHHLEAENVYLQEEVQRTYQFEDIVGDSPGLERVLLLIEQVASTAATVLVQGETGTGKELVARALHGLGQRKHRPLVKVNCAALPASLIESELFGHEKGAYTGAVAKRTGRFELADGGTLFLDEIGDMPLELQAKLLRVLEDGEFERLGSSKTLKVDVRVIAATNRDLENAVSEGRFREDLYYRLRVFPIEVPPLRARTSDIPLLVGYMIDKHRGRLKRNVTRVLPETMEKLKAYAWPGNVRELENVIARALILSPGETLVVDETLGVGVLRADSESMEKMERTHILSVLEGCGWRIRGKGGAADRLDINPSTLRSRMKKLEIQRPLEAGSEP